MKLNLRGFLSALGGGVVVLSPMAAPPSTSVPAPATTVIVGQTAAVNPPASVNVVPPVGGTMAPGAVGGQLSTGAVGGQLSTGAVGGTMAPAVISGAFPTLPMLNVLPVPNATGTANLGTPSTTVIITGGNLPTASGGVLNAAGVGGASGVIVTGGATVATIPGGAFVNNVPAAVPSTVIVTGGSPFTASPALGGTLINNNVAGAFTY
jgi:hypothetical protein